MLIKQEACGYYLGRNAMFQKWILVVSVESKLAVIQFSE